MQRIKMNNFGQFLALVAMAMFVLPLGLGISLADEAPAVKIKHKPIKYYVPEKRIRLEAKVKSEDKIDLVRCYFRGEDHADYVFVPMEQVKEGLFEAILPAPSVDSERITYLFLVVIAKNNVVRTQKYSVEKSDQDKIPAWQDIESEGEIHVSTELAEAPETVAGFTDSILVDVVESAARFGYVAQGIYITSQILTAGGASGTAAAATSAGTVTASTGVSTAVVAGGVVAGAAVVGGLAAVAGSSDDSSPAMEGAWQFNYSYTSIENRNCYVDDAFNPYSFRANITVDGNTATLTFSDGSTRIGSISGDVLHYEYDWQETTTSIEGCTTRFNGHTERNITFSDDTCEGTGFERLVLNNISGCRCGDRTDTHRQRITGTRIGESSSINSGTSPSPYRMP